MCVGGWASVVRRAVYTPAYSAALLLILEPPFQCQPGDPAVKGAIAIGGLGQRFDGLGLECNTLLAGMLKNIPAPRGQTRRRDPCCQSPHEAIDQPAWPCLAWPCSRC